MTKYHLSSDGNPRVCTAAPGNCPLGADAPHFSSKVTARMAYEASLDAKLVAPSLNKKNGPAGGSPSRVGEDEILTEIPEREFTSETAIQELDSLTVGQQFFDDDGELLRVLEKKSGPKNVSLVAADSSGKQKKIYRPKTVQTQAIVKTETPESEARRTAAYRERSLERALKKYEPQQAKALADLTLKTLKGYRTDSWDYRRLMAAAAQDEVYHHYEMTVDSVRAAGIEGSDTPYTRAFEILKADYTRDIIQSATYGESKSTSEVSNSSERENLKAKAEFLNNIRWL